MCRGMAIVRLSRVHPNNFHFLGYWENYFYNINFENMEKNLISFIRHGWTKKYSHI